MAKLIKRDKKYKTKHLHFRKAASTTSLSETVSIPPLDDILDVLKTWEVSTEWIRGMWKERDGFYFIGYIKGNKALQIVIGTLKQIVDNEIKDELEELFTQALKDPDPEGKVVGIGQEIIRVNPKFDKKRKYV